MPRYVDGPTLAWTWQDAKRDPKRAFGEWQLHWDEPDLQLQKNMAFLQRRMTKILRLESTAPSSSHSSLDLQTVPR